MAPFRIAKPRFLAYLAFEGGLIFGVLYGLAYVTPLLLREAPPGEHVSTILLVGALFVALLVMTQWSNPTDKTSLIRELVVFSTMSVALGLLAFASVWVLTGSQNRLPALLLLEGAIAVPLAVAAWRWLTMRYALFDSTRETVLILGTGEEAKQVCRWIGANQSSEYAVLGFADENAERLGNVLAYGARIQTSYAGLPSFATHRLDRVIVALDEKRGKLPVRELMDLRLRGVEIEEATTFFERVSGRIAVETLLPSWLIFSEGFKTSSLRSLLKRTVDVVTSTLILVLHSPLLLLTAIAIRLDSPGPVLYRQIRLGRNGKPFQMLKFRSMRDDAETRSGPMWAQENDPRVTRVGRVIRRLRLDELPQLFNVLRGEMSFVGPRPERLHFVKQLELKIPYYGLRMTVRPGITGWAQVEYGYGGSEEDALEKLKYDLYYIKNGNLLFDLWIVLKTLKVVLMRKGR